MQIIGAQLANPIFQFHCGDGTTIFKGQGPLRKKHMHTDAHKLNASYSGKENKKTANEMETLC